MGQKTNKTEHVLKLLTSSNNAAVNPLLNEVFKNEKIHSRHNEEKSQDSYVTKKNGKVDILKELVKENIDSVIERFNVCNCDECKNEITKNVLSDTKPVYVDVSNDNFQEVKIQKELYKNEVISNLVKYTIKAKVKHLHNK